MKFDSVRELVSTAVLALGVSAAAVVPAYGEAPFITQQRTYTWDNFPEPIGQFTLRGQGFDTLVTITVGESPVLLWTTFDVTDTDCDIDRIKQEIESAPPGVSVPIGGANASTGGAPKLACGGQELFIDNPLPTLRTSS
jgi:hypothetical protein